MGYRFYKSVLIKTFRHLQGITMAKLVITQSVGLGGVNTPNDVKAVQVALNNLLGLNRPQGNWLKTADWVLVQRIQKL
jgi:hypothetical protein